MKLQVEQTLAGAPPAFRVLVKVVPGSRQAKIVGWLGERLKVKVSAPPEDGRANKALCGLLAESLGLSDRAVEVVAGHSSPEKTVRVVGIGPEDALSVWGA